MPKKKIKNPWLSAILNFILPGLGYVYVGKRVGFGIGLVVWGAILLYSIATIELHPVVWLDAFVMDILFAYDGYKTAEEVNKEL